jgi:hypothetical protein
VVGVTLIEFSASFFACEGVSYLAGWDWDTRVGVDTEIFWLLSLSCGGVAVRLPAPLALLLLLDREIPPRDRIRREMEEPWGVRVDADVGVSVACSKSWEDRLRLQMSETQAYSARNFGWQNAPLILRNRRFVRTPVRVHPRRPLAFCRSRQDRHDICKLGGIKSQAYARRLLEGSRLYYSEIRREITRFHQGRPSKLLKIRTRSSKSKTSLGMYEQHNTGACTATLCITTNNHDLATTPMSAVLYPLASFAQISQTPSREDGITIEIEEGLRAYGCKMIQQAGLLLKQ